jgi:hypothetical protein
MVQKHANALYLIDYYESEQAEWAQDTIELKKRDYNWGKFWLPHDCFAKTKAADGISSAAKLRKLGWTVPHREEIKEMGIEEGIKNARLKFSRLYIDKTHCAELIEHAKRYRRHITQSQNADPVTGGPVHDVHSHAGDMIRYLFLNEEQMTNEDEFIDTGIVVDYSPRDSYVGL